MPLNGTVYALVSLREESWWIGLRAVNCALLKNNACLVTQLEKRRWTV